MFDANIDRIKLEKNGMNKMFSFNKVLIIGISVMSLVACTSNAMAQGKVVRVDIAWEDGVASSSPAGNFFPYIASAGKVLVFTENSTSGDGNRVNTYAGVKTGLQGGSGCKSFNVHWPLHTSGKMCVYARRIGQNYYNVRYVTTKKSLTGGGWIGPIEFDVSFNVSFNSSTCSIDDVSASRSYLNNVGTVFPARSITKSNCSITSS